jgi:tetratricopeptide (TPR) repeat protein
MFISPKNKVLPCLIFAACALSLLVAASRTARAALPQFMGGSGVGVSGQKANLDGTYPTFWDNLMKQQSYYNLAQGMSEMNALKYKEAAQTFGKAVVKNPQEPYPHIFLGIALYWQGQVDPAMAEYRAALELDPKNAEALQLLGIAYAWKGDIKSALDNFKQAIDINPNRPDTQMNLGSTYAALGNLDDALYHFRRAVELDDRHPLYQYQLASLYEVMGRDDMAQDAFKKAIRLYPSYEEAMLALAVLYEKMGSNNLAEFNYKKALKLKPGDSVARLRLANLLIKNDRKKEAMEILDKAFFISPLSEEGLALSIAYTGGAASASAGGAQQSEQQSAQSNKQLEQFKHRVQKIPSSKQMVIEVEVSFEPKTASAVPQKPAPVKTAQITENGTKNKKAKKSAQTKPSKKSKSALASAVEAQDKQDATSTFTRAFAVNDTTPEGRAEQLNKIFEGLNNVLTEGGKQYNVKMSLRARAKAEPAGLFDKTPVNNNPTNSMGGNSKAGYNPYMVGNDMGLWVAGKGWMKYIEDVFEEITSRAESGNGEDLMIEGLAYMTFGRGQEALESFSKAQQAFGNNKDLQVISGLAKGTAFVILGDDNSALNEYKAVLALSPKNKTALNNIEVLTQ